MRDTIVSLPSLYDREFQEYSKTDWHFLSYLDHYSPLLTDFSSCSVISSMVRICPPKDREDFEANLEKSMIKELSAAVCPRVTDVSFDFRSILSDNPKDRTIPFSNRLPPMAWTASIIYQRFCEFKSRITDHLFMPSIGKKTVGRLSSERFWEQYDRCHMTFLHDVEGSKLDPSQVTPMTCERMYIETGYRVDGPVEVRQAWKYTDLKPRVYYARGGDVLESSLFIQEVANELCDSFPEVHRYNRYNPPFYKPTTNHLNIIYDYSSFTSCLNEIIPFIDALSNFFEDTPIRYFDTRYGIQTTSLGRLFREYNNACNRFPEFVVKEDLGFHDHNFTHHCGMLGVPGNIFLSTLLHGIHTHFISGEGRSKCVGDDASIQTISSPEYPEDDSIEYAFFLIESLGSITKDKLAIYHPDADTLFEAYHYLKRPIFRLDSVMVQDDALVLPRLDLIFNIHDGFHTHSAKIGMLSMIFSQIRRLINVLTFIRIAEFELVHSNPIVALVYLVLRKLHRSDPIGEHGIRRSIGHPYSIPPLSLWTKITFEEWLKDDLAWDEEIIVPMMDMNSASFDYSSPVGSSQIVPMSKGISLLGNLGYVTTKLLYETISRKSVAGFFDLYFSYPPYRALYEVTCIVEIPDHFGQIP